MIKEAIVKVIEGHDLTRDEAVAAMNDIMNGEATDAQIGGFLVAMRLKGETVGEISSFATVMREKASAVTSKDPDVLDTCGTGGDGAQTFNISTVTAFVAAGAGITVAKHGNRSVSSRCGSADLIEKLGIRLDLSPEQLSQCLDRAGLAFLFAPKLHASMKYAIGPRRELGVRTFFNILGPMTNPAGARRQLMGVYDIKLVETIARVLADLGTLRAFVVHGSDGLDEVTLTGETFVSEVVNGGVKSYMIKPEDFGLGRVDGRMLLGGDADANAEDCISILKGAKGPKRDIVILNSAFAICAGGKADSPFDAVMTAVESLDSGAAMEKYLELREISNK